MWSFSRLPLPLQEITDPEGIFKRFIALSQTIKPKEFEFVLRFISLRQFDANELESDFSDRRKIASEEGQ